jgi:hypothetical protein
VILSELSDEALVQLAGDFIEHKYGMVPLLHRFRSGEMIDHWSGLGAILTIRQSKHKDMRLLAAMETSADREWLLQRAHELFLDSDNRKWYYDGNGNKRRN